MTRKTLALVLVCLMALCACSAPAAEAPAAPASNTFTFTHYASGGTTSEGVATILFEKANSTFTKYQVAFTSCTCRDAAVNFSSVMYVEILNTKDTADEASIRYLSFGEVDGYTAGMWGDSDPIHGRPEYTFEYMNENFVSKLEKVSKADIDAWQGYGYQLPVIDADALTGATVSTGNVMSVLDALMDYHAAHYYAE